MSAFGTELGSLCYRRTAVGTKFHLLSSSDILDLSFGFVKLCNSHLHDSIQEDSCPHTFGLFGVGKGRILEKKQKSSADRKKVRVRVTHPDCLFC